MGDLPDDVDESAFENTTGEYDTPSTVWLTERDITHDDWLVCPRCGSENCTAKGHGDSGRTIKCPDCGLRDDV